MTSYATNVEMKKVRSVTTIRDYFTFTVLNILETKRGACASLCKL